ncbi:hypothetical protein GCM10025738_03030 [Microbacterium fluvii]
MAHMRPSSGLDPAMWHTWQKGAAERGAPCGTHEALEGLRAPQVCHMGKGQMGKGQRCRRSEAKRSGGYSPTASGHPV